MLMCLPTVSEAGGEKLVKFGILFWRGVIKQWKHREQFISLDSQALLSVSLREPQCTAQQHLTCYYIELR